MSILAGFATKMAEAALGPVLDVVKDLGGKWIGKKISDEQFKVELYKALLLAFTNLWQTQADVIKAEIQSDSWLTRSWRPITAVSIAFVLVAWYGFLVPILVNWIGLPPLAVGDTLLEWLYTLLTMALGGYVVGRTAEKITDKVMKGK